jgi:hypothetical protein
MPPRARKGTTDPASGTTTPAKPARAKKTAAKKPAAGTARKGAAARPNSDAPRGNDVEAVEVPDTESTVPGAGESEPEVELDSQQVLSSDSSTDSSRNTHVDADGTTVITTRSSRTDRTRREYGPGHTVDQTVTTATERVERIPVPYAGPASEYPAPVG